MSSLFAHLACLHSDMLTDPIGAGGFFFDGAQGWTGSRSYLSGRPSRLRVTNFDFWVSVPSGGTASRFRRSKATAAPECRPGGAIIAQFPALLDHAPDIPPSISLRSVAAASAVIFSVGGGRLTCGNNAKLSDRPITNKQQTGVAFKSRRAIINFIRPKACPNGKINAFRVAVRPVGSCALMWGPSCPITCAP
jgi:hypothetical protein